jgi:hypothetical protein
MSILYKHISSHCLVGILNVRRPEVTASRRSFIAKQDRKYYVARQHKQMEICWTCFKQETGQVEIAHSSNILKREGVEKEQEKNVEANGTSWKRQYMG